MFDRSLEKEAKGLYSRIVNRTTSVGVHAHLATAHRITMATRRLLPRWPEHGVETIKAFLFLELSVRKRRWSSIACDQIPQRVSHSDGFNRTWTRLQDTH